MRDEALLAVVDTTRKRIFVLDDHPDTAATLADLLGFLGHETQFATDPRQAIAAAKQFKPDLALIDLAMPHISGWEIARLFRNDPELKEVSLIVLTAFDDATYRRLTREARFDAHIQKPAGPELLEAIIAQFE